METVRHVNIMGGNIKSHKERLDNRDNIDFTPDREKSQLEWQYYAMWLYKKALSMMVAHEDLTFVVQVRVLERKPNCAVV